MKAFIPLAALAGLLAYAFTREEEAQKAPKLEPRPGQPQPGGKAPIPGVPSIPAPIGTGTEPQVPPSVLSRMVAALGTGDPKEIRRVASQLEKEGFPRQASELRAAADALEAARPVLPPGVIPIVTTPPPGAVPVPKPKPKPGQPPPVLVPAPGGPPPFVPPEVSGKKPKPITISPIVTAPPVIKVPVPPPGAVPVPPPVAAPAPFPVGAIPDQSTLVGKTALMLWESAPGPVRDPALLAKYKKSVGLSQSDLYGAGTAKSFMVREIVPPTPWDWPSDATKRRALAKDLAANYKFKAGKDTARREEWLRAAAELAPFMR